jgi:hypothetical protein
MSVERLMIVTGDLMVYHGAREHDVYTLLAECVNEWGDAKRLSLCPVKIVQEVCVTLISMASTVFRLNRGS